jgi:hypothetical protein
MPVQRRIHIVDRAVVRLGNGVNALNLVLIHGAISEVVTPVTCSLVEQVNYHSPAVGKMLAHAAIVVAKAYPNADVKRGSGGRKKSSVFEDFPVVHQGALSQAHTNLAVIHLSVRVEVTLSTHIALHGIAHAALNVRARNRPLAARLTPSDHFPSLPLCRPEYKRVGAIAYLSSWPCPQAAGQLSQR